eukprot:m.123451 g.123451  ORF g.123451 m.123451 type:complete len:86 (+) comp14446_c0_seq8:319-576(+)
MVRVRDLQQTLEDSQGKAQALVASMPPSMSPGNGSYAAVNPATSPVSNPTPPPQTMTMDVETGNTQMVSQTPEMLISHGLGESRW